MDLCRDFLVAAIPMRWITGLLALLLLPATAPTASASSGNDDEVAALEVVAIPAPEALQASPLGPYWEVTLTVANNGPSRGSVDVHIYTRSRTVGGAAPDMLK